MTIKNRDGQLSLSKSLRLILIFMQGILGIIDLKLCGERRKMACHFWKNSLVKEKFPILIDAKCCRIHFGGELSAEPDRKIKIWSVIYLPSFVHRTLWGGGLLAHRKNRNYLLLNLYFSFGLHYLPFLLYIHCKCLAAQPDSSDLLSGIFTTHGWCPKSKFSRTIYYVNFHHLVVCKGTYILFCGKLYPLQCFLNEDILPKANLKSMIFFLRNLLKVLVPSHLIPADILLLIFLPCAVGFGLCIFFHLGAG